MYAGQTIDRSPALQLHEAAMSVAKDLKNNYVRLFELLLEIESRQLYYQFEVPSFEAYCTELLELSPQVTKDFRTVVRKSLEIPELAEAIISKNTTVSKVRKICSVITRSNHKEWIALVNQCSSRVVEKAVAAANPRSAVYESMTYVSSDILELKFAVSEKWSQLLERTKDLMSQKECRAVSTEEALFSLMNNFVQKSDPVIKAKRILARTEPATRLKVNDARPIKPNSAEPSNLFLRKVSEDINELDRATRMRNQNQKRNRNRHRPAIVEHEVDLRDRGQCVHIDRRGFRCESRRWLEKHRIIEFANGGRHKASNLETLCSAHHKLRHIKILNLDQRLKRLYGHIINLSSNCRFRRRQPI